MTLNTRDHYIVFKAHLNLGLFPRDKMKFPLQVCDCSHRVLIILMFDLCRVLELLKVETCSMEMLDVYLFLQPCLMRGAKHSQST